MTLYLLKRFAIALAIMLGMVTLMFIQTQFGDDPRLSLLTTNTSMTGPEQWDAWGKELGLDRPAIVQYGRWVGNAMRGDFGVLPRNRASAFGEAVSKIPGTLKLVIGAFIASAIFAALVVAAAMSRHSPKFKYAGRVLSRIGPALPVFLVGLFLFHILFAKTGWISVILPRGMSLYVLPSATLGMFMAYAMVRPLWRAANDAAETRTGGGAVDGDSPYGVGFWTKAIKTALLNLLGHSRSYLFAFLTAVVVTEVMFGVPGVARLIWQGLWSQDMPVFYSAIFCLTAAYAASLLLMDVVRWFVDPGVRSTALRPDSTKPNSLTHEGAEPHASQPTKSWPVFGRRPLVPAAILIVVAFLAIFGPLITPHDLALDSLRSGNGEPPPWVGGSGWSNVLGVDIYGRDLLSLIIYGARYSLTVAFAVLVIGAIGGFFAIAIASRLGRFGDRALAWTVDFTSAFPTLLAGHILAALILFFPSLVITLAIVAMLAVMVWGKFIENLRREALRSQPESRLHDPGSNSLHTRISSLNVRQTWPRLLKTIVVTATLNAGTVILLESTFSFLGIIGRPDLDKVLFAEWGSLARQGLGLWWMALFPGLAIALTVLSLNFLGRWVNERFDSRPNQRLDSLTETRTEQHAANAI